MAPARPNAYLIGIAMFTTDYPAPLDEARRRLHKARNWLHTWTLLLASVALLALTAWLLAGPGGIFWVTLIGGVSLLSASRMTPDFVLRLYRARPLPATAFPDGNEVVSVLARRAGLKPPSLHLIASRNMNAFAVGRPGSSAIAVTDGLIRGLSLRQFAGVMAHEISHLRNGDVKVMALADMVHRMASMMQLAGFLTAIFFAGAIFSGGGAPLLAIALLLVAPVITGLLQLALNRTREYDADLDAVGLTGDPEGLASALQTLERRHGALWEQLMLPGGGRLPDPSLLRTHPRTEERVARLLALRKPAAPPDFGGRGAMPAAFTQGTVPVVRRPRLHRTGVWY